MALPDGWIQQHDPRYNRPFWVDTRSNPPRSIWVHPYEDEQFLAAHPELKRKEESSAVHDLDVLPSYDAATDGRASGSGDKSNPKHSDSPVVSAGPSSQTVHKRGVFGRLKDRAIGTKEEREEQRRVRAERAAQAEERARQARMRQLKEREAYMRAYGGYAPYHSSSGAHLGNNPYGHRPTPTPGPGGDNTAALLLGGLAGGLLLGDILGGGFF